MATAKEKLDGKKKPITMPSTKAKPNPQSAKNKLASPKKPIGTKNGNGDQNPFIDIMQKGPQMRQKEAWSNLKKYSKKYS